MKRSLTFGDYRPLAGRVAVVSGAGGLLGREHAAALRLAGAHVVLADASETQARGAADAIPTGPGRVIAAHVDVTDSGSVTALRELVLERFDRIDVLVNNAALNDKVEDWVDGDGCRDVLDYPLDAWREVMEVNVTGTFLMSQVLGAPMVAAGSGSIINIASTYGIVAPNPSLYADRDGHPGLIKSPAYPTSKAAVLGLTRYLAAAWGASGIRVNALAPGGVENGQEPHFIARYAERTPLRRMASPDDYHGALVFLASDASTYMTGATLVVDGGFTAW